MHRAPLDNAYRRLGARYPRAALTLAYPVSVFVVAGGILLLNLYVDVSLDTFWRLLAVSEVLVIIEIAAALWLAYRLIRPATPGCGASARPKRRSRRGPRSPACRSTCCASAAACPCC
jgi:adenylate cyclase